MPFTLAHAAAALPFKRSRLVPSALVMGTFAPDFEYFLRLAPRGGFGHTLPGVFFLSLPLALLVLWIFQTVVKEATIALLPGRIQRRLTRYRAPFQFFGDARFPLIVISALIGIATHILWDSFTHPNTWAYRLWPILGEQRQVPILGEVPYYSVFQHGSTLIGLGVLMLWFMYWYRSTQPKPPITAAFGFTQKLGRISLLFGLATASTIIRIVAATGLTLDSSRFKLFVGEAVVTWIALVWWELVAYGVFRQHSTSTASA